MTERVVITGLGALSGLGEGAKCQFEQAVAAVSGITELPAGVPAPLATRIAAQTPAFDAGLSREESSMFDRVAHMSWKAAQEALTHAGLTGLTEQDLEESGVFWGTGFGGAATLERSYMELLHEEKDRIRPFSIIGIMANGAAGLLALKSGFRGPSLTYSTACASSAHAIGEAFRQVRAGYCKRALAGGAESLLTYGSIKAWEALRTLARLDEAHPERSCKPFSRNRSGFVLGEGAAAVVLESLSSAQARGAHILAEVVGYGTSTDAIHVTKPDPAGQARAMRSALKDAQIAPQEIAYINAHGTATAAGDAAETESIKLAFGEHAKHLLVSSTKAVHGHTLGAAGALELIITLQAQQHGVVPPTAFLEEADPALDLDYVALEARSAPVRYAMSNSFAFGGSNAALITKAWQS
jgi:3-oxoacyl-[acyl-carrier-protein] synthase II